MEKRILILILIKFMKPWLSFFFSSKQDAIGTIEFIIYLHNISTVLYNDSFFLAFLLWPFFLKKKLPTNLGSQLPK